MQVSSKYATVRGCLLFLEGTLCWHTVGAKLHAYYCSWLNTGLEILHCCESLGYFKDIDEFNDILLFDVGIRNMVSQCCKSNERCLATKQI